VLSAAIPAPIACLDGPAVLLVEDANPKTSVEPFSGSFKFDKETENTVRYGEETETSGL
jgi:hypothetical protein